MSAKNNLNFVFGSVQHRVVRNYYLVNIPYKITIKMKSYNLLYRGEEEKMSYARGEKRLERSEWDCFTIFRLSLFLSARYILGIS
jgi:hypothetical protein